MLVCLSVVRVISEVVVDRFRIMHPSSRNNAKSQYHRLRLSRRSVTETLLSILKFLTVPVRRLTLVTAARNIYRPGLLAALQPGF